MKKLLLTLAALPMVAMAAPAAAQGGMQANANAGAGIENRIGMLETRLSAGVQARTIDRNEERNLRQQIRQLRQLQRQYSAGGFTQQERSTLQQRIRTVRDQLRTSYGTGYAWNDNDWDNAYGNNGAQYDQYGRPVANSGVRYDQNGRPIANGNVQYDQYGRPLANTGVRYDQNGRPIASGVVQYDQYGRAVTNGYVGEAPRSGIGNVIGNLINGGSGTSGGTAGILGRILGNGGLSVGDLVSGSIGSALGGVPSNYSSQFQNRNNVYFRSDGQRVYEVDARTNTVVRVHPLQR